MPNSVSGKNELSAVLQFLRKEGGTQKSLAQHFKFNVAGKSVSLDKTTLSSLKKLPNTPKHRYLLKALKEEFSLELRSSGQVTEAGEYKFLVEYLDEQKFKQTFEKIFGDTVDGRTAARLNRSIEQDKLQLFEGSRYAFYDRVPDGIERHIVHFREDGKIEIQHADGNQNYTGNYKLDKTRQFIIVNMHHRRSREKAVTMHISIGQGDRPQLCVGLYLGMGKAGGGCEACTIVLMESDDPALRPKCFYGYDIDSDEIPQEIKLYLKDPKRNRLAAPPRITDMASFKEWRNWKNRIADGGLFESTQPYLGSYHMFYHSDDLQHYVFEIFSEDRNLKARIAQLRAGKPEPSNVGIGTVSRYNNILYINLDVGTSKSFIQMEIGGDQVDKFECFCGIVTGMDAYQQQMVAYPVVIVREEVYQAAGQDVMKHIHRFVEREADHRVKIKSPNRLSLAEL